MRKFILALAIGASICLGACTNGTPSPVLVSDVVDLGMVALNDKISAYDTSKNANPATVAQLGHLYVAAQVAVASYKSTPAGTAPDVTAANAAMAAALSYLASAI